MDLAETMKSVLAKNVSSGSGSGTSGGGAPHGAEGYVTEKLYMLLQLYLQNKGWSPSIELLQCFSELKESSMLPSAAYLQMMASRVGLDTQGRLILRENGKIILPYEHFANAVMLKHMNGPHGLHLGIEGTVRAVVDSYTIGREQFGMEKEFIIEVVQNCPNPACRYYKSQLEMTQKSIQQHLSQQPTYIPGGMPSSDSKVSSASHSSHQPSQDVRLSSRSNQDKHQQQQLREAMLQQQNRAIVHQSMEKYGITAALEHKQRSAVAQLQQQQHQQLEQQNKQKQHPTTHFTDEHKLTDFLRANLETLECLSNPGTSTSATTSSSVATSATAGSGGGQERVVRAFAELARNLQRMRPCVRPAMCKPYGKQSEQLQKILLDTIQLVQSLRSYLPPPHIQVTSWKNDDKLRSSSMEDMSMETRKIVTGN